jgi:hypothetical protein
LFPVTIQNIQEKHGLESTASGRHYRRGTTKAGYDYPTSIFSMSYILSFDVLVSIFGNPTIFRSSFSHFRITWSKALLIATADFAIRLDCILVQCTAGDK